MQAADGYIPLVYPYEDTRHRIQQLAICILKIYFLLSCVYGLATGTVAVPSGTIQHQHYHMVEGCFSHLS